MFRTLALVLLSLAACKPTDDDTSAPDDDTGDPADTFTCRPTAPSSATG